MAMILTALYLSLFVAALDATIVATALPMITSELHSAAGYIWVGGAYLIANAAAAPIWVKFSDIWGRKPIFLAAVIIFFASSIVCALAVNMKMLITGRAIQGAAGGGLICMVNVGISDLFSVRERSLWLGFCEGVWSVSGAVCKAIPLPSELVSDPFEDWASSRRSLFTESLLEMVLLL
jgi:MFS family permease